jgi:hypothetical protein
MAVYAAAARDKNITKTTELSIAIFVLYSFVEIDTETMKINTKIDIDGNRHGSNTVRTRTKNR